MARSPSPHTRRVLEALAASAGVWRHGYDIAQATGVKSGTLYPMLIRLAARGLLEAEWQSPSGPHVPPRHAYRLTAMGARFVAALPDQGRPHGIAVPA